MWLQGESDMPAKTDAETYMRQVTTIKNALKKDLGLARFGIIRVGRFSSLAPRSDVPLEDRVRADEAIMAAQDALCERDGDFLMLTRLADDLITGDGEYVNPNATGHFSALGLETLGQAASRALGVAAARGNGRPSPRTAGRLSRPQTDNRRSFRPPAYRGGRSASGPRRQRRSF